MPVFVRAEGVRADTARLRRRLATCLLAAGAGSRTVNVLLAGDARLRRLNRTFRRTDKTTDVLSFEASGDLLGDVAISVPACRRYARRSHLAVGDEALTLGVHGLLHLRGHDHAGAADRGRMRRAEDRLLARFGLRSGLARAAEGGLR